VPKVLNPAFFASLILLGILSSLALLGLYPKPHQNSGRFKIHEVSRSVSSIQTKVRYSGTLNGFPCAIYLDPNKPLPKANKDYMFESGELKTHSNFRYTFKPTSPWVPIEKSWSFAHRRFQAKAWVKEKIHKRYQNPKVATLLAGLATGNLESPLLSYHFNAVGLAHLLAISGFHFALLTFFLSSILKKLLPEKVFATLLIVLLGAYFFYMGGGPSISRAWIAALLYLIGVLFGYRTTPLNALGVALLFALITDPFVIAKIGFQLSFSATLGIILFYRKVEDKLCAFFPKRPYDTLIKMSLIDQCGYLLCAYLRKGLALQLSVLSFSLPLILFHFEAFPLISFFYNLFVPFLLAAILALFALQLDFLVTPLTSFMITLIEGAPRKLLLKMDTFYVCLLILIIACIYSVQKLNFSLKLSRNWLKIPFSLLFESKD